MRLASCVVPASSRPIQARLSKSTFGPRSFNDWGTGVGVASATCAPAPLLSIARGGDGGLASLLICMGTGVEVAVPSCAETAAARAGGGGGGGGRGGGEMVGGTGAVDDSECGVARVRGLGKAATDPAAGREQQY